MTPPVDPADDPVEGRGAVAWSMAAVITAGLVSWFLVLWLCWADEHTPPTSKTPQ